MVESVRTAQKNPGGVPGLPVHTCTGGRVRTRERLGLMIVSPIFVRHSAIAIFLS